jgi:hypothetical protein
MRTDTPTTHDRRAVRSTVLAFAATMAIALRDFAIAVAGSGDRRADSPEDAVRGFLISAGVDGNSPRPPGVSTPASIRC